jgi:predicted AAA+ superfamily ATPase
MKIIERPTYLNRLIDVKNTPDIKVITGIRRSGKSRLMEQYGDVLAREENANVVHINLRLNENKDLRDGDALYRAIREKWQKNTTNYLLIDEVQMCEGFEDVINSVHDEELYDIYITGSNAFLLSSDLAALFGGRVFEISVYPFSFAEYMSYYPSDDIDSSFDRYFRQGGMSGSYVYRREKDANSYVKEVLRATVLRNIEQKYNVGNENLLLMIANYLMDNIGSETSVRNIAAKVSSDSYRANDKTVGKYLTYLTRSFLFYPMQRYDIRGKAYLETNQKYYLADLSFRYAEIGTRFSDRGHLFENLVALELLRRDYEVYVGKLYEKKIDFVAIKDGMPVYIQVSDDITDKKTLERETAPLLSVRDTYPKMLIARTRQNDMDLQGIRVADIARWLAGKQPE